VSTAGHLIADRYRLVTAVGTGGMGVVWEGWDERLHRRVAVKQLRLPAELTDRERELASQRAMREARITARLHHRHAITVFDVVDDDGRPSLIMQFVPSRTLSEILAASGPLPAHEAARMGAQVASALSAAHELGIVHRDVKPGNVLVAEDGTAHISDFGISRALDDITMTTTGMVHGTPAYLSPEVARGEEATFASDLFGLGATLYAALEGSPPFGTDTNSIALLHRVAAGDFEPPRRSGPLTPLLLQLLSSDPAARPPMHTAETMLLELASSPPALEQQGAGADGETTELIAPIPATTSTTGEAPSSATEETVTAVTPAAVPPTAVAASQTPVPPAEAAATVPPAPVRRGETGAETTPVATPAATSAATPAAVAAAPPTATPADPHDDAPRRLTWRRRRTFLVGVLVVALAAVAIGTAFLVRLLGGPDSEIAGKPPGTSTVAASTPTTRSKPPATTKNTPTDQAEPSPDATPTPSPRRSPTPTPTPPPKPSGGSATAARLRDAITGYYALIPGDTDRAWNLLTDGYKASHTSGRQGYQGFWDAVDRVEVGNVTATPPNRSEATLTYHFNDGRVVVERTSFQLVDEGGTLKIADSTVLSSTTL
jgi:hypothetical protein